MIESRKKLLQQFCSKLHISFNDISLLDKAFFHRSASNEGLQENNERLEFLGDAVLGLSCASYLFKNFTSLREGELSKIKSVVVSEKSLSSVARLYKVDELLVLGHGEQLSGGKDKDAILADCMEAIIGAYYIDSGFEKASFFVLSFLRDKINEVLENKSSVNDWKTILQEFYQKNSKHLPLYETVESSGPDHDRTFKVIVKVNGKTFGPESGKTKKEAEQKVAKIAYKFLTEN